MEDPGGSAASFIPLGIIIGFILLGGFFSLFEASLTGSRKTRLMNLAGTGAKKYRRALKAAEEPQRFLTAARMGINLIRMFVGVLGGFYIVRFLEQWKQPLGEVLAAPLLVIAGTAALFFAATLLGGGLPRLAAQAAPEQIFAALLPCFRIVSLPILPLALLGLR
ncbi:MAG: CNNM domain-containing protein, partial [Treponema sp.]|nr:CNNM domain-containing protein [Treponema sp.]